MVTDEAVAGRVLVGYRAIGAYLGDIGERRAKYWADQGWIPTFRMGERLLAAKAQEIEARNARTEARLVDVPWHREMAAETFARLRHHVADLPAAAGLDEAIQDQLRAELERITHEAERLGG